MFRKNDGFFLAEQLLSVLSLVIIALFIIPLLLDLVEQGKQLQKEKLAYQLLFEEMNSKIRGDGVFLNRSILVDEGRFDISWNVDESSSSKEVCVQFEKGRSEIQQYCERYE